jgi:predicted enzyme related to lactoylglutathione lyase
MSKHRFCWADLATVDDLRAAAFYAALFGWSPRPHAHAGGRFTLLEDEGTRVASLYRLAQAQVASGMPSHWLPYVSTPELSDSVTRARALGGDVIVTAQAFPGLARIAVMVDPTGALFGLWQSDGDGTKQAGDARDDEPTTEGNR